MSDPDFTPSPATQRLPVVPDLPETFLHRHRAMAVVVAVVVVLAVAGVIVAVAASPSSPATPAAAPSASSGPSSSAEPDKSKRKPAAKGTRGTVSAEQDGSWTLTTTDGRTVTVVISQDTRFGTVKTPVAPSAIPVGSAVVVVGQEQDGVLHAQRIRPAKA